MYQLISSTRFDPFLATLGWNNDHDMPSPFFLLPYHFDRLVSAARTHNWDHATTSYDYLKSACSNAIADQNGSSSAFRIRILLSQDGQIVVTATPLAETFTSDPTLLSIDKPLPIDHDETCMKIYMDTEHVTPSIFTTTKTTFRDTYNHSRTRNEKRLQTGSDWTGSDVLLYNDKGCIMEATIFNVALYRSSKWVTPSTNSGCLPGVMRRWLLQNRRIYEDESACLTKDSIQPGEWVLLFNGVQGCRLGKVYM
ncbi:hypothetical protein BYT27DRAFT_7139956 [Phlegmacium glaucopus]|nr:hypothetical protein BYT27DRAFT_7139956 [Phlegmacium glaucopus]